MWGMKVFLLFLLLAFGSSISSGRYIEDASDQSDDDRDHTVATEDDRDIEEQDELQEDRYSEEERDDIDGQENRDTREEVVRIPGQSSDEREREETEDNEEEDENDDEFEEEEREVDNWHDDRMMDSDEGGMSLAGQAEENMSEQTDFEGFKRKVEEIEKANEDMQAEINKLKTEFDKALSSDSKNGVPDTAIENKPATQHDTSSIHSREDLKGAGIQQRTYSDDDMVRRYSEIGEDANIAPDDDY